MSKELNKGLYVRGSFGFGQFTTKKVNETTNLYKHQYAIVTSLMGGVGYTIPYKRTVFSLKQNLTIQTEMVLLMEKKMQVVKVDKTQGVS